MVKTRYQFHNKTKPSKKKFYYLSSKNRMKLLLEKKRKNKEKDEDSDTLEATHGTIYTNGPLVLKILINSKKNNVIDLEHLMEAYQKYISQKIREMGNYFIIGESMNPHTLKIEKYMLNWEESVVINGLSGFGYPHYKKFGNTKKLIIQQQFEITYVEVIDRLQVLLENPLAREKLATILFDTLAHEDWHTHIYLNLMKFDLLYSNLQNGTLYSDPEALLEERLKIFKNTNFLFDLATIFAASKLYNKLGQEYFLQSDEVTKLENAYNGM